ncbi:MAG: cytochrome c biogenesis protein CcsA [Gemmatimonadaceae bacterium]|nr:cytochrome c biogenesis protein CcsA [Gemmatimonadaceae bacterium]
MTSSVAGAAPAPPLAAAAPSPVRVFGPFVLLALAGVAGAMAWALLQAPLEATQGAAQKIFYVHVPSAIVGQYLAAPLIAIGGALYLWLKDERLDRLAESAAELALLFLSLVLVTGPLWGKPIWGTWWTWDARLTTTLFLWFLVLGYLVLRSAIEDREQRGRYSAVLGIVAALVVPFNHLTVRLFRTLHPQPIVIQPDKPNMTSEMTMAFLVALAAFAVLFVALLRVRMAYAKLRDDVEAREALA